MGSPSTLSSPQSSRGPSWPSSRCASAYARPRTGLRAPHPGLLGTGRLALPSMAVTFAVTHVIQNTCVTNV
jgi:hypothetical protein